MQQQLRLHTRGAPASAPRQRPVDPRLTVPRAAPAAAAQVVKDDEATWAAFAKNFAGEWEGVSVAFDADGARQPLDAHYVPDAYREWGVELFDWQTQCSCDAGEAKRMSSALRRLMPTVGCEADAVAYTEDTARLAGGPAASGDAAAGAAAGAAPPALAYLPDGSYSAGPECFDAASASRLRFEACFAAEGLSTEGALKRDGGAAGAPAPRYDGPFTGRKELAGCGGGAAPISSLAAVPEEQLAGSWVPEAAVTLAAAAPGAPLLPEGGGGADAAAAPAGGGGAAVVTRLPLGAWSAVRTDGLGRVYVEAGALAAGGRRQVAARAYEGGAASFDAFGGSAAAQLMRSPGAFVSLPSSAFAAHGGDAATPRDHRSSALAAEPPTAPPPTDTKHKVAVDP
ncbi:MAG: hypothetical protein J3K34DRAFT_489772 [Monoraphidium minutum]|nr:MAG: hypothetical protein J3K34DRAFT_489772 [Monoraphidium minutum]